MGALIAGSLVEPMPTPEHWSRHCGATVFTGLLCRPYSFWRGVLACRRGCGGAQARDVAGELPLVRRGRGGGLVAAPADWRQASSWPTLLLARAHWREEVS